MSEKNTVALNERDSSSLLSSCGVRMTLWTAATRCSTSASI